VCEREYLEEIKEHAIRVVLCTQSEIGREGEMKGRGKRVVGGKGGRGGGNHVVDTSKSVAFVKGESG